MEYGSLGACLVSGPDRRQVSNRPLPRKCLQNRGSRCAKRHEATEPMRGKMHATQRRVSTNPTCRSVRVCSRVCMCVCVAHTPSDVTVRRLRMCKGLFGFRSCFSTFFRPVGRAEGYFCLSVRVLLVPQAGTRNKTGAVGGSFLFFLGPPDTRGPTGRENASDDSEMMRKKRAMGSEMFPKCKREGKK